MTRRLEPHERKIGFWLNVEKLPNNGCWLWRGAIRAGGYGQACNGSRTCPQSRERGDRHWTRRMPEKVRGEANANATLTDRQVRMVRAFYADGLFQYEIADMYGVWQTQVSKFVRREQRSNA